MDSTVPTLSNDTKTIAILTDTNPLLLQHRTQAQALAAEVDALAIRDDESLARAAALGQTVARGQKSIKDFFAPMKKATDDAHKAVCGQERTLLALWDKASATIRTKLGAYHSARLIESQRLAREEADRQRLAAVDKTLDDAIEMVNLADATGDPLYAKAAEQILDTPVRVVVQTEKPKAPSGVSFVSEVDVILESSLAFIRAIASGAVVLDPKTLDKVAEAARPWVKTEAKQRGQAFDIPGWARVEGTGTRIRS